jgi:transposase
MTPERMFQELLGLGLNWEVVESRFGHQTSTVVLEIRETDRLWESERCPKEGGLVYCYDHTEELVWRHLNVFQHRCEIRCRLPRKKCRQCGGVYRVRPPWEGLSGDFSREFEAFALLLAREMPVSQVGKLVGESDTRLWRMIFKPVAGAYAEADFSNVGCVGVDELNIRKGQEYVSVFADLLGKRVMFATEGRDKSTWERFVQALEAHNGHRHAITQASMDMSPAYRSGVAQTCRNAQVVFDKFHVICHANEAVDQARRAEIRYGARGAERSLRRSQWLWRKNPENLTQGEQERMEQLDQENLGTAKADQMRLCLQDIYRLESVQAARHRFLAWCRWVRWAAKKHVSHIFLSMLKVAKMIETNLQGILAHWKWRLTNAFMEGLNSVFQATKRKARGYRSSEYLITMLYFVAGKLRLPHF